MKFDIWDFLNIIVILVGILCFIFPQYFFCNKSEKDKIKKYRIILFLIVLSFIFCLIYSYKY